MGLFALHPIAAGERVIGYKGELISWRHAAVPQRSRLAARSYSACLTDVWSTAAVVATAPAF
jgi:hypothetical protein